LDAGLAKAERPEDQRTMRDRFISPAHLLGPATAQIYAMSLEVLHHGLTYSSPYKLTK
jgi:hypothetical protein